MSTASNLSNLAHLVQACRTVDEKLQAFDESVGPKLSYEDRGDLEELRKASASMMALIESHSTPSGHPH
ncbi:MAG TPA: hypothetical protein VK797_23305 [Tepidisphaeraceae bacterium]|jgi:hypothetical protein|nr:hypothetical protein [Tepidisphaeraceae bacterium]